MADEPKRKRPVSTSRTAAKAPTRAPAKRAPRAARPLEDDEPTTNYALRLTEGLVDQAAATPSARGFGGPHSTGSADAGQVSDNFALRLTQALEAISAAQGESTPPNIDSAPKAAPGGSVGWLAAMDKLPPIRLPVGPPIPWRLGLPMLAALVIVMGVMSRSAAHADTQGVQLPAQQTYPVQQEAPLFAKQQPVQPADTTAPDPAPVTQTPQAAQPIGVQDTPGLGIDVMDLAIKLVAVLGLAYGSLMLLKRVGVGGSGVAKAGGNVQAMRVVSSLALAPNRSVHVIKAPGGRTLLVGATPNAVNLLCDLGELADDETPEAGSFLDVLKGKIGS